MVQYAETRRNLHTHTHGCLCKIIISIFAILAITNPSYSTTISGTGTECNENTLNTDSGPATLQAQWNANTINLNWYSDDTQITVPTASNTCTYDSGITLPTTNPTKEGYTFAGWAVRLSATSFDLSTLNTGIGGLRFYARGWYDNAEYCFAYGDDTADDEGSNICTEESAALSDIAMHQWKAEFSYGTVKGVALCNTTNGTWATAGTPDESETGRYCWCKGTGFAEPNSSNYSSVASSSWVFDNDNDNADNCARNCAHNCAYNVQSNYDSAFRRAVFGQ